jgi:hypothetical protein
MDTRVINIKAMQFEDVTNNFLIMIITLIKSLISVIVKGVDFCRNQYNEIFESNMKDYPQNYSHDPLFHPDIPAPVVSCNTTAIMLVTILTGMTTEMINTLSRSRKSQVFDAINEPVSNTSNSSNATESLVESTTDYVYYFGFIWAKDRGDTYNPNNSHHVTYYKGAIYQSFCFIKKNYKIERPMGYPPSRIVLKKKYAEIFENIREKRLTVKIFNKLCMPSTYQLPDSFVLILQMYLKVPINTLAQTYDKTVTRLVKIQQ